MEYKQKMAVIAVLVTLIISGSMVFNYYTNRQCCRSCSPLLGLHWKQGIGSSGKLKQWGYYDGPVDGVFGPSTYDAVIRFQRKHGLKQDGVVGLDGQCHGHSAARHICPETLIFRTKRPGQFQ